MAVTSYYENGIMHYIGLSSDTKPTPATVNSTFYETDTGHKFKWDGSAYKPENTPLGAQIGADTNFILTSITAGNTVSATFTLPAGGAFDTVAISILNPATADLTVTAFAVEATLGNCEIGTWMVTKSSSNLQLIRGAFLGTNLLMRISPTADCNSASGTAVLRLRGLRPI